MKPVRTQVFIQVSDQVNAKVAHQVSYIMGQKVEQQLKDPVLTKVWNQVVYPVLDQFVKLVVSDKFISDDFHGFINESYGL
jgi:hypothetical protein